MYKLYTENVLEEIRSVFRQQLSLKLQEELMQYKVANVYEEQIHKAKLILNKYEVLTREYQNQNKSLKENHERIIASERQKRQDIISNFENHLSQIKQQIKEDT